MDDADFPLGLGKSAEACSAKARAESGWSDTASRHVPLHRELPFLAPGITIQGRVGAPLPERVEPM